MASEVGMFRAALAAQDGAYGSDIWECDSVCSIMWRRSGDEVWSRDCAGGRLD
jgi:hypothetical protein